MDAGVISLVFHTKLIQDHVHLILLKYLHFDGYIQYKAIPDLENSHITYMEATGSIDSILLIYGSRAHLYYFRKEFS